MVRAGDRVRAGQRIAKVGHLVGITVPSDMLHLELYDNTAHGPLTVSASEGKVAPNGRPFMRRGDLIDPTPKLNIWKNNLPGGAPPAPPVAVPVAVPARGPVAAAGGDDSHRLSRTRHLPGRFGSTAGRH